MLRKVADAVTATTKSAPIINACDSPELVIKKLTENAETFILLVDKPFNFCGVCENGHAHPWVFEKSKWSDFYDRLLMYRCRDNPEHRMVIKVGWSRDGQWCNEIVTTGQTPGLWDYNCKP